MAQATVGINWFEIPVTNLERAVSFYSTVLDTELGEIPGPQGTPLKVFMGAQGPSGALMSGEGYTPGASGPLVYLGCDDINAVLERVAGAGGEVLQEHMPIGEYGAIGLFIDSEGNRVALHAEK